MSAELCPQVDELRQAAGGYLSRERSEVIAEHVIRCDRCGTACEAFDMPDALIEAVRRQPAIVAEWSQQGMNADALVGQIRGRVWRSLEPTWGGSLPWENTPPNDGTAEPACERYDFLAPPQADDELGRLGSYRVLRAIGSGGMGVVFEAEDLRLKRRVALKCMKPVLAASTSARKRFVREAQIAASVEHDHIVPIFQVGEEHGIPFIAMPLLRGETLAERLRRRQASGVRHQCEEGIDELPLLSFEGGLDTLAVPPREGLGEGGLDQKSASDSNSSRHELAPPSLPLSEVLRIGSEVAEGLAAAHERGLIHRDIKPGNIWLEAGSGRAKILDFGLARAANVDEELTLSGMMLGTPSHMAPEQARGEAVDARADLFSLGCVLYQMSTGVRPFVGRDSLSTVLAITTQHPPRPREINSALPAALDDLIVSLLSKDPAGRPQSAREVLDALLLPLPPGEGWGEGGAHQAAASVANDSPAMVGSAHPTKPPRRRVLAAVAAAAAAAAMLFGVVIVIKDRQGKLVARVTSENGADVTISPEYTADVAPAPLLLPSGEDRSEGAPKQAEIGGNGKPHRSTTPAHSNPLPDGEMPEAAGEGTNNPESKIQNPKWLPPLSPMALITEPTAIDRVKSWTVETRLHRGRIYQAEFSPDGTLVATLGIDATLRLWDPATGKLVKALLASGPGQHSFAWSRDGKHIAVGETDRLLVWNVQSGKLARTIAIEPARQVFNLAWSLDGGTLAVAMVRGADEGIDAVELFDVDSGELLESHPTGPIANPLIGNSDTLAPILAWSPSGDELSIGHQIWDRRGNMSRNAGNGVAAVWRDDGVLLKALPVGQGDQAKLQLWRAESDTLLYTFSGNSEPIAFKAFSPGGNFLLATAPDATDSNEEGRAYVWHTTTGGLLHSLSLAPDNEWYTQYALSPDGQTILAFGTQFGNMWSVGAPTAEDGPPGPSRDVGEGSRSPFSAKRLWNLPALLGQPNALLAAWAPDGASLAWRAANDGLCVWELSNGWPRFTRSAPGHSLDWRNSDGLIRVWQREGCVVYDPATGQQRRYDPFVNPPGWPFTSLDGSRVAAAGDKEVTIYATGSEQALRTLATVAKYAPAWSHDSARLVTVGEKTAVWDLDTGEPLKEIDASAPVEWSPDGQRLAYSYDDGKRFEIRDVASGQSLVELENDPAMIVPAARLSWSPDSSRIAGFGRVWDANTGKALVFLPRFPSSWLARRMLDYYNAPTCQFAIAWSPDGASLAYLAADRSVMVAEAATGRILVTLLSCQRGRAMSFSPQGHFRVSPRSESELVYVVETDAGQETLSPQAFADRHGWRNGPALVGIGEKAEGKRERTETDTANTQDLRPKTSPLANPKSLGPLALVQRPAALAGVESWSLEPTLASGALSSHTQMVAISPEGKRLAVGGDDGHVRIYDPLGGKTPRLTKLLIGHASRVVAIDWSPDGNRVASAEAGQPNVRVWDAGNGKLVSSAFVGLSGNHATCLAWSPDSATLAVGGAEGAALIDPITGDAICSLVGTALALAWSPDGANLAVADVSRVAIYDVSTGDLKRQLAKPEATYSDNVAWSPDGALIALSAGSRDTLVWDVGDGTLRARLPVRAAAHHGSALCWLDEGGRLGLNTNDQWEEWDVVKGERASPASSSKIRLSQSADGHVVAETGAPDAADGSVWAIDVVEVRTRKRRTLGFRPASGRVAWSPERGTLAAAGGGIHIWSPDRSPYLEYLRDTAANATVALKWLAHSGSLLDVHGSTDAAVWSRAEQGWQRKTLGTAASYRAVVSSDGKLLAYVATHSDGKTVTTLDLVGGAKLRDIDPHAGPVFSMAWSPDAKLLALGGEAGEVTIWDAQTGKGLHSAIPFSGGSPANGSSYVTAISWSPNGGTIAAVYAEGRVCLCDGELNVQRQLRGHVAPGGLKALGWSDDGKVLLTVDDYQLRRWDVAAGKMLGAIRHRLPPLSYDYEWQFSPDLARIAASGAACRIVKTSNGEQDAALVPLRDGESVVISAEGHYLASGLKAIEQLTYVVQTVAGQELLSSEQFAEKYGWKNDPSKVSLPCVQERVGRPPDGLMPQPAE